MAETGGLDRVGATPGGMAELVLANGVVHTVDAAGRRTTAVAVRGGRIVAVGTDREVRERAGPSTEVIDLRGRAVLPGFQDAHVHAPAGGLDRFRCDLSGAHDATAYAALIDSYAGEHPDEGWILGGGWSMDVFPGGTPGRAALDELVPDRPVFLSNRDHHAAWVNGRALELAGVDTSTPDPPDGRIERDAAGTPSGTLHEGAMALVRRVVPTPSADDVERGVLVAQEYLHSLGITAWQDAIVGDYPTMPNAREAYPALDGRGLLTARVVGALWWDRDRGLEQVDELVELRHRTSTDRYRPTTVKIMVDGVCESFTARMLEPYLDGTGAPTDNRGLQYVEPDLLRRAVTVLDGAGFQVHLHTIGDGAVRHALDAIEAARTANGPGDHRHHLAHLQVVHPDDRPRFRRLGVVANIQPLWASNDPQMTELTIPFLGSERASWQYPFGSLAGEGAILAVGSDWPVSSPDVLQALHVAVHRISPPGYPYAGTDEAATTPFLPEERIDLARAIRAATMGSAHVNHLDDVTGSIEVGKDADLVVLSADPFGPDPDPTPRVEMTLVGGRAVFDELDR